MTADCRNGSLAARVVAMLCHSGIAACLPSLLTAQQPGFEVVLRSGEVLRASAQDGVPALVGAWPGQLTAATPTGPRSLAAADVLAILGGVGGPLDLPVATLAGGEQLCGTLVGGDAAGERFALLSPVLGTQSFPVERLAALAGPGPDRDRLPTLPLPRGVEEALVRRVPLGFDWTSGTLHQLGAEGLRFQPAGQAEPRWFRLEDLVGIRLGGAAVRAASPAAWLSTRTGDVLGVQVEACDGSGFRCRLETGAAVQVAAGDVASLVFLGSHVFVSDLDPVQVAESGLDGDAVWPWRRDRAATGGWLLAGGRTYAKGLGVHSQSRLVFRAPPGATAFWTRVALDDSAAALPLVASADVRIAIDGKLVFERRDLRPGMAPLATELLPVVPGAELALEVDCGKACDLGDRVDWLLPVFLLGAEVR